MSRPRTATTRARSVGMNLAARRDRHSPRRGTPPVRSRWSCWMSMRNMSGALGPAWMAKSRSRFACSLRTPRMKNEPRPTASRMTRVWLPGRAMCSTACRSAKERAYRSGCTARTSAAPARCSTSATPTKPAGQHQPDLDRAGLPRRDGHQGGGDAGRHAPFQPVEPAGGGTSCRSSSDGLT